MLGLEDLICESPAYLCMAMQLQSPKKKELTTCDPCSENISNWLFTLFYSLLAKVNFIFFMCQDDLRDKN